MDRKKRIEIASETASILKEGHYVAVTGKDILVSLSEVLNAACEGTILHLPDEKLNIPQISTPVNTKRYMTTETTLQCLRRLSSTAEEQEMDKDENIVVLNFASAKNPGGGLHRGSWEQEEYLAASTGLVSCLETKQAKPFYDIHKQLSKPGKAKKTGALLYTSNMIYSPFVPVFRNQKMELLSEPYTCSVLSSCCVNYNTGMFNKKLSETDELLALNIMQTRVLRVLQVAAHHGATVLILGTWGCDIHKNSPKQVAKAFNAALLHPDMEGRFKQVVFAVPHDESSLIYKFFAKQFVEEKY